MGRTANGALRPMLNNEFVFQTGMLDQVTRRPTLPADLPRPALLCFGCRRRK